MEEVVDVELLELPVKHASKPQVKQYNLKAATSTSISLGAVDATCKAMEEVVDVELLELPVKHASKPQVKQYNLKAATSTSISLGAVDATFCKGRVPAWLELLVHLRVVLDQDRLVSALDRFLQCNEPVTGHRDGTTILSGGVRISVAAVSQATLELRPPPAILFDAPRANKHGHFEVLTLRLASAPAAAHSGSTLGLTWTTLCVTSAAPHSCSLASQQPT